MRVGELLAARAASDIIGREAELARLQTLLDKDGPRVAHLHGIPGIGKSALLQLFTVEARTRGANVLLLDCREIEPTPEGFLAALADITHVPDGETGALAGRLGERGCPLVIALDTFEVFRLLDNWLRVTFIPVLPEHIRIILVGRHHPAVGWRIGGWERLTINLHLGPLDTTASVTLLSGQGAAPAHCRKLAESLHGHPLALRLAASAMDERPELHLSDATLQQIMDELTAMYLADVSDPVTCRLLEGAALVRRITVTLLGALFPDLNPDDAYQRLSKLIFTEASRDGLHVLDAARDALSRSLHARNPEQHLEYRRDAWRALNVKMAAAARPELWRYTADILYLIENPVIREAFFPSGASQLAVEQSCPDDLPAIRQIVQAHEGPEAAAAILGWWDVHPESIVVIRGIEEHCSGFCCRIDPSTVHDRALQADPITAAWRLHLADHPIPAGKHALFIRRWLGQCDGESPGDNQAACWMDLKRTYMEMRPDLHRVYLTVTDLGPYAAVAQQLGFRVLADRNVTLDGRTYHTAVLDFGPDSVDGWLADLAAAELGLPRRTDILDQEARELVLDDRRVPLTPLEFGVLVYLRGRQGQAVSREGLLRHVWGSEYTGWSNKVDTVIAGLRRKLCERAGTIETVTGVGYRYRHERTGQPAEK